MTADITLVQVDIDRKTRDLNDWLARRKENFIGGKFVSLSSEVFQTVGPATNTILSEVEAANQNGLEMAISCAKRSFQKGEWRRKTVQGRAEILRKLASLIHENRLTLAVLETLDTGKPITESFFGDILRSATNFEFFATFACEEKEMVFDNGSAVHRASRTPLGVVAAITPWNLPLYLATWKIAPALMMGNSVILKPSELTPLTATFFCELVAKAGIPDGVFQMLHGGGENQVGEWLTSHPEVRAISFTGETQTGKAIMKTAASHLAKVSFELGGKGASILMDDADMDFSVSVAVRSAFRNQGQICLATPRFYIAKERYTEFCERFAQAASSLRIGDPLRTETQMGSLVSLEHRDRVEGYLSLASPDQMLCGGRRPRLAAPFDQGAFLTPTILAGLADNSRLTQEEIFGPVASVYSFSSDDEVVDRVNDTKYGLSAAVFSNDTGRAQSIADRLDKGMIWMNDWFVRDLRVPFGGMKQSGIGREGGRFSLDFFSEWKSVCRAVTQ